VSLWADNQAIAVLFFNLLDHTLNDRTEMD